MDDRRKHIEIIQRWISCWRVRAKRSKDLETREYAEERVRTLKKQLTDLQSSD